MTLHRRSFLAGLGALIAAPAIVRASALMPVKPFAVDAYVPAGEIARLDVLYGSLKLRVGDIITFDGIEAWNRSEDKPAGQLRQFVVTASGPLREKCIYPPIVDVGQYRTVVARPKGIDEIGAGRLSIMLPRAPMPLPA